MSKVVKKEIINDLKDVYDLEVEGNHNYISNGLISHNCKDPQSQQSKGLLKISKNAKYRYGLTGTLLINSPLDLFMPMKFIGHEKTAILISKTIIV